MMVKEPLVSVAKLASIVSKGKGVATVFFFFFFFFFFFVVWSAYRRSLSYMTLRETFRPLDKLICIAYFSGWPSNFSSDKALNKLRTEISGLEI